MKKQSSITNPTHASTMAPKSKKQVHFAQDRNGHVLADTVVFHDLPTAEEAALMYDSRDEATVYEETLQQVLSADPPLSGALPFTRSIATLQKWHPQTLHSKAENDLGESSFSKLLLDDEDDKAILAKQKFSFHTSPTHVGLPRHVQWAIRTICGSDLRGLEGVYQATAVASRRKAVQEAVFSGNGTATARDLYQQASAMALLLGHGDASQVVMSGMSPTSPREPSRPLRNPAA